MWTTACALAGILLCWVLYKLIPVGNRFERLARKIPKMDRAAVLSAFEAARRCVISQLRNPYGKQVSQAEANAALEIAVACLDRLDQLESKQHGPANRAKIRRVLETRFRREADYWVQNESGIEMLGREQEPSVFAARPRLGPFPR